MISSLKLLKRQKNTAHDIGTFSDCGRRGHQQSFLFVQGIAVVFDVFGSEICAITVQNDVVFRKRQVAGTTNSQPGDKCFVGKLVLCYDKV